MVIIIGAGISGLSAANRLNGEYLILEKENYIGGLSTQYRPPGQNEYWFDFGGHYFHFKDKPEIKKYLESYCKFDEYKRKSSVFVLNRFIPFPIQYHLAYLPARVGKAALQEIREHDETRGEPGNLRDYLENHFGPTLFALFFEPFLGKYYRTALEELAADMDKGSIPPPDKKMAAAGAGGKKFSDAGYNPFFYYPHKELRGFIAAYARDIIKKQRIRLNEEVIEIDSDRKIVKTATGAYHYDFLINTMPLRHLLKIIKQKDNLPTYRKLRHVSTIIVNVVLKRRRKRLHWVYLPGKEFPFYRAGFYPGRNIPLSYLEKTVAADSGVDKDALFAEIVFTLKQLKLIEDSAEVLFFDHRFIPVSYVLFDRDWCVLVPPTLENLEKKDIYSTGRYGAWNYTSMSDDVKAALAAADQINSRSGSPGQVLDKI